MAMQSSLSDGVRAWGESALCVQDDNDLHGQAGSHGHRVGCKGYAHKADQQADHAEGCYEAAEPVEHPLTEGPGERDEVQPDDGGDQRRAQVTVSGRDQRPRPEIDQGELPTTQAP